MNFPEHYRVQPAGLESLRGDTYGVFSVPAPRGLNRLFCIATDGDLPGLMGTSWEHVAVMVRNRKDVQVERFPTWEEMCVVRNAFWPNDQTVIQLHRPERNHPELFSHCLHLWRPIGVVMPVPAPISIAPKTN